MSRPDRQVAHQKAFDSTLATLLHTKIRTVRIGWEAQAQFSPMPTEHLPPPAESRVSCAAHNPLILPERVASAGYRKGPIWRGCHRQRRLMRRRRDRVHCWSLGTHIWHRLSRQSNAALRSSERSSCFQGRSSGPWTIRRRPKRALKFPMCGGPQRMRPPSDVDREAIGFGATRHVLRISGWSRNVHCDGRVHGHA